MADQQSPSRAPQTGPDGRQLVRADVLEAAPPIALADLGLDPTSIEPADSTEYTRRMTEMSLFGTRRASHGGLSPPFSNVLREFGV